MTVVETARANREAALREAAGRDEPATGALRVMFFGKLADRFGRTRDLAIPARGCTVARLKDLLGERVEDGRRALGEAGVRTAIDRHMAMDDAAIARPGQEVAFLPAFSGG